MGRLIKIEINLIIVMSITNKYSFGSLSPGTPAHTPEPASHSPIRNPVESNGSHQMNSSSRQQGGTVQHGHGEQGQKYQYPYEFRPNAGTNAVKNPVQTSPAPTAKGGKNTVASSLESAITSHANPIYSKVMFPILKNSMHSARPNSEDNKYEYYHALQKEARLKDTKKRAESETKKDGPRKNEGEEEEGEGKGQHQHQNRSPFKPGNYNQYTKPSGRATASSQSSTPPKTGGQVGQPCDQQFLQKCLQHIMIQNSCLTKQVVLKELELSQLREQLQKMKTKHDTFRKTKVDVETFGNMEVIVSASEDEDESEKDSHPCSIGIKEQPEAEPERQLKKDGWAKKPSQSSKQEIDISFSIGNSSSRAMENKNLQDIESLIQEIENQQKKLESNLGRNMVSQEHKIEGMEFTRLDRLRMKKGLASKRNPKQVC